MKRAHRVFAIPLAVLPIVAPLRIAVGQEKATAQEVVATVRKAAGTLSKTGDLTAFKQKHAPWVWKDTYVFVIDCDKNLIAAHPIRSEEHTSELQSPCNLVCRLLLEKKKKK